MPRQSEQAVRNISTVRARARERATKEDVVIELRTPHRAGDVAAARRRRPGGVLVVALDDTGLGEALPVAAARVAACGGRITVAGSGSTPWWWCLSASGWVLVPDLAPG